MRTIHLLEHDGVRRGHLARLLKQRGHAPQNLANAQDYFYQLGKQPPRCVVVDWLFSDISGLEIVQRTRQRLGGHVGLLMLTDTEREDHAVLALNAGADDCFARPARDELLAARIESLLRRLVPAPVAEARRLSIGPYTLDLGSRSVTVNSVDAGLAPREFDLAWLLFSQPSRLLTKDELLTLIWGKRAETGAHTIAQNIYALRKKLAFDANGFELQSVYASGYRLERLTGCSHTRIDRRSARALRASTRAATRSPHPSAAAPCAPAARTRR
jgi:DNA-binding response OmpR family regulator